MTQVALLFSGQGSQYVGMGRELVSRYPAAQHVFDEASDVLGIDMQALCFESDSAELTKTENAQPAILTVSVAMMQVFRQEFGLPVACMAGHSLGEITALTATGAIDFADALKIVRQRGKFMQEASRPGAGSMAAVGKVPVETVERVCRELSTAMNSVVISNYNAPSQTVISGHEPAVRLASTKLQEQGASVVPLKVSAAFHSPLMQPAAKKLNQSLKQYAYHPLKWPVFSNVTAQPYRDQADIVDYLTVQMTQPVRWSEIMEALGAQGIEVAIELGPKSVLRNLMRASQPQIHTCAFDLEADRKALQQQLQTILNEKTEGFSYER